jgi:ribosomal-protein-alanine N-acetyltransferase
MSILGEFPEQETERLILRKMTLQDLGFYFRHFNITEIIEGCCFPGPKDPETARKELELYCINPFKEGRGLRWGITLKGDDKLIGTCGLYDWKKTTQSAEIGYDLDPAYWGQGIMTEALKALLNFGFEKMGLNRIQAVIDSKNKRSIKLVRGLGFTKEGVLRQRSYFNGQFRDDVIFSLLKEEWKTQKTK